MFNVNLTTPTKTQDILMFNDLHFLHYVNMQLPKIPQQFYIRPCSASWHFLLLDHIDKKCYETIVQK